MKQLLSKMTWKSLFLQGAITCTRKILVCKSGRLGEIVKVLGNKIDCWVIFSLLWQFFAIGPIFIYVNDQIFNE